MAKIQYVNKNLRPDTLDLVEQANEIIDDYQEQGFTLTLRQLYYQFVSKDLIANNDKSYTRLGTAISNGRLVGLIDWEAIEDRLRTPQSQPNWVDAYSIVDACADQFQMDRWRHQQNRVEVWIEKDALTGVIDGVCTANDVTYFACRGNVSQSAMWRAAMRLKAYHDQGQQPIVLHMGDHDPSGIDMTRDNQERLDMMAGRGVVDVRRIAMNMDQIEHFGFVPNPVKKSDSKWKAYVARFGVEESWELDAISPPDMVTMIQEGIDQFRDLDTWAMDLDAEQCEKDKLNSAKQHIKELPNEFDYLDDDHEHAEE